MPLHILFPLIAQATVAGVAPPPTLEQDRLSVCLDHARSDATSAIAYASQWSGEAHEAGRSYPLQCLGIAYSRLLRWDAAEEAFVDAREAALESDHRRRARLGAMAGNAALPAGHAAEAANYLSFAHSDALAAGDATLAGDIAVDLARALVALDNLDGAAKALEEARRFSPQNADGWLLSATLERRRNNLERASAHIATAAALAPDNGDVGLEGGVIAMLAGDRAAARRSWNSVKAIAPGTPAGESAIAYLAQLDAMEGEAAQSAK